MAASHELQTLLKKVKLTPHDILVEVVRFCRGADHLCSFPSYLLRHGLILRTPDLRGILKQSQFVNSKPSIWSCLSLLGSGNESASKPKAPPRPKKKAPPSKKSAPQHVTLSHYYPLFWTVVSGETLY